MAEHIPYTIDYSGRQVDVELLQSIARPVVLESVTVSSVTQPAKIVTGIQKLVQRYTSLLLAITGTTHFDSGNGSVLLDRVMRGAITTKGRLINAFAIANGQAIKQLKRDDKQTDIFGSMPDDEQIQTATLLNADIDHETATAYLQVQITSRAGDNITFIVPTTAPR